MFEFEKKIDFENFFENFFELLQLWLAMFIEREVIIKFL